MNVHVGAVPYTAKEADYYEGRLNVLNQHFQTMIEKKELLSGSYCLSHKGKVFANNSMGYFSYEEDEREFQPDTIFMLASITKTFTAVAIAKLVEDGKIRYDQTVGEIIEEFSEKPFDEVKIIHLLTHTSGLLCNEGSANPYASSVYELIDWENPKDWIKAIRKHGFECKPGEQWHYNSMGFTLLGEIISRVSGQFANDYIMDQIIKPLGMKDTRFFRHKEFLNRYNIRTPEDKERLEKIAACQNEEELMSIADTIIPGTAGRLYSTCSDLNIFGQMIVNYGTYNGIRILGRKAVECIKRIHTSGQEKDYCWGRTGIPHPYGAGFDMTIAYGLEQVVTPGSLVHEGFGTCSLMIDFEEKFVATWAVQFRGSDWYIHSLRNVASIMWSGIL